ncbi:polysaccharide deacetylase family protein [Lentisalinibacter salinarum]|uniref:polysaccharide deacetylase family protein n=1 Tax=Lentisalinibacter salinarum TaxID=2992239 RepID=UPI003864A9C7
MWTDPLIRRLLAICSPAGSSGRLSIFIFHRVLAAPDPLFPGEVDVNRFSEMLSWITKWFHVLPLGDAVDGLQRRSLPARSASITFDDGYTDNATNALPILQRHDAPATFFVATGYLNGGRMWNDTIIEAVRSTRQSKLELGSIGAGTLPTTSIHEKQQAIERLIGLIKYRDYRERDELATAIAEQADSPLPDNLMMTDTQVRELHAAGMTIGAHTVDHPILRLCDSAEARREISASRDYLEALSGDKVTLFAYPNGKPGTDYLPEQARLVEELGFKAAVSTAPGASRAGDDVFQLRRFTPWDRSRHKFAARLALNLTRRD